MFVVRTLIILCILSLSPAAAASRARGNDTAPYANLTAIITTSTAAVNPSPASSSPTTQTPSHPISSIGTGIISGPAAPQPSVQGSANLSFTGNDSAPCTVNIPSANIHWWYAATYDYPVGRLRRVTGNFTDGSTKYYTNSPNTEAFDVTSVLETDIAYTTTETFDSEWGVTWTYYDEYSVKPTAALTSVVTRSAGPRVPPENVFPDSDITKYDPVEPNSELASTTFTAGPNSTSVVTSATPFLYFSAYEVESVIDSTTTTETVHLPFAHVYSYWLKGIEEHATATGVVPAEFLQQIPQSACDVGRLSAIVTVLIVVTEFYLNIPNSSPFIIHVESSVDGWGETNDIFAANTGSPDSPKPFTPSLDFPADATPTEDDAKPAVLQTRIASTQGDFHNAGSNPPNVPDVAVPTQHTVGTVGTNPVVIGPSSVVVIGTQTLQPGAPPVTIGGNPVSLAPSASAIIVRGRTSTLPQVLVPVASPQNRPPPILTIGSVTLTANAATQFFVGSGQTLTPGGTATIGGTVVSLAPSASFVVVGGSTQIIPTAAPTGSSRPEIVIGGSTFTANTPNSNNGNPNTPNNSNNQNDQNNENSPGSPNNPDSNSNSNPTFIISGQTLTPEGHAITVDGTTVSLGPSGSFVVINGATSTLQTPNPAAAQATPPPLTIDNGIFTALPGPGTSYRIGSQTLTPGGIITAAGTTISLASGATALIINGQTTILSSPNQAPITNPPDITIGSQTFTAAPGTGTTFVIAGQTLTPGGTITVDGTTMVLAPGATQLVYGSAGRSTTTALFPATTTRSQLVTGTEAASAGPSGDGGGAAQTGVHGAGYSLGPSWAGCGVIAALVGVVGVL